MEAQNFRNHCRPQLFPGCRVAEKARHADQELLEKDFRFLGVLLQITHITGNPADLVNTHPPLNATVDGVLFVQGEIVTTLGAQQDQDLLQRALILLFQGEFRLGDDPGMAEISDDLVGQLLHRGDNIGQPRADGAARHAVELGRGRFLHQDDARLLLDRLEPERPIRAHAGEDHADAPGLAILGQSAEKEIDRETQAARRDWRKEVEDAVQDRHIFIGGDDINAVRLDLHPVFDLKDLHGRDPLQEFGHDPLMGRVEMLDDDESQAAAGRHMGEEDLQGLQAASRGADADDRKERIFLPGKDFFRHN